MMTLIMMRARGLLGPIAKKPGKGVAKPATVKTSAIKSVGVKIQQDVLNT